MRTGNNGTRFLSNNAGGVLGGISTGQPVVVRFAVKPTSSILSPRKTVDRAGADTDIMTKGRHDPCVGIRAVPVGEAMMACVLADHFLRHRGQVGAGRGTRPPSLHRVCDLFRRHQGREIGVGARHHREDRGVDHAQTLHALDAALRIDDRHRIVRPAHPA